MTFDDLKNPELQEKLKTCKNPEELLELVKAEGFELTDEDLEGISGGQDWWKAKCGGFIIS